MHGAARKGSGALPSRIERRPAERSLDQLADEHFSTPLQETRVPQFLKELPTAIARRRIEIVSSGIDEYLQTQGSDPLGNISWPGVRVPGQATSAFTNPQRSRYLFVLASFSLGERGRARIVGMRTSWTLGAVQTTVQGPRVIEQLVTNPFFRLPDGNVSFHLRQSNPGEAVFPGNTEGTVALATPPFVLPAMPNLVFKNSKEPALLFQAITYSAPTTFYPQGVLAYTPPNQGQPYGRPLTTGYGTFNDLRTQYASGNDWGSIDLPVEGPATFQLFASVRQSNPATRPAVTLPLASYYSTGLSPEEAFLLNFPTAIIWRVAGTLAVEMED